LSIRAVAWALDQDVSDAYAKLVLIGMCDSHNGETSACHPAKSTLARKASCSIETVTKKIKWLVENGWIEAVPRFDNSGRQTSNSYSLLMDNIPNGEGVSQTRGGVPADRGEGVYCDTPIKNRNKEPEYIKEKKIKKENPRDILLTVLDEEHTDAVIEHRKKKKAPLTDFSAKRLAAKFALIQNPNDGAAFMIERGYQGFEVEWMHNSINRIEPQSKSERYLEHFAEAARQ